MTNLRRILVALIFGVAANVSNASILTFYSNMNGAAEVPPSGSPATGFARIVVDTVMNQMFVDITFSGLTGGNAAAAHIHCCTPVGTNVAVAVGFPGFPAATSGTYSHMFNLLDPVSIYTTSFVNTFGGGTIPGAEAALIAGLLANRAYTNIHNATFPGGEIRGQLALPEPETLALFGVALAAVALGRRRIVREPSLI